MIPIRSGKKNKGRALIVEGGGMRGAFTGGALAAMTVHHPSRNFDLVVGVSSGSCAAAYYVTESSQSMVLMLANLNMWRYELTGSRLISFFNPLRGKTFLNQEYLVDHLFGNKYRLHREKLDEPGNVPFYIVVSNIETLKPEYIKASSSNIFTLLKASTSMPIATKGKRNLDGKTYTDGGVLDPLPVQAVIDAGYTDITVVLTNPRSYRSKAIGKLLSKLSYPFHGRLAKMLNSVHHVMHINAYEIINRPPRGVKIRIIDPDSASPARMITRSEKKLNATVDMGFEAAMKAFTGKMARTSGLFRRIFRIFRPQNV